MAQAGPEDGLGTEAAGEAAGQAGQRLAALVQRLDGAFAQTEARLQAGRQQVAALQAALNAAEAARQQAEAALATLEARARSSEDALAASRAKAGLCERELVARDVLLGQLRRVNGQLRDNNRALREAMAERRAGEDPAAGATAGGVLMSRSMLAELEGIRLSREADRAEIDRVLAALAELAGVPEARDEEAGGTVAGGSAAEGAPDA